MVGGQSKLILSLVLAFPAVILTIVIFIYFALNRIARSDLKNHGWLVLLATNSVQLTLNLPMPISFYYFGYIWPSTNAYCTWWTWLEFSLNSIGLFLMAWISVERHILIFHSNRMLERRWWRCFVHFLPLAFCVTWAPTLFFTLVVVSPLCTNEWDFNQVMCGFPCYYGVKFLNQFDFIFNLICPTMIILIANVTLVIRVIHQRLSRHQPVQWRRHRKMVLQLWLVSSLYLGLWLPLTVTLFVQNTFSSSLMAEQMETLAFAIYFVPLLLPAICLSTQPELVKKLIDLSTRTRRPNTVGVNLRQTHVAPGIRS